MEGEERRGEVDRGFTLHAQLSLRAFYFAGRRGGGGGGSTHEFFGKGAAAVFT